MFAKYHISDLVEYATRASAVVLSRGASRRPWRWRGSTAGIGRATRTESSTRAREARQLSRYTQYSQLIHSGV